MSWGMGYRNTSTGGIGTVLLFVIIVIISLVIINYLFKTRDIRSIKSDFTATPKEKCSACGRELNDQWKGCPYCGKEK